MTENAPTNGCERSRRQANYRHHPDNGLDKMRNNTNPREDNTCPGKIITEHLPNTNLFGVHTVGFFGGGGGECKYTNVTVFSWLISRTVPLYRKWLENVLASRYNTAVSSKFCSNCSVYANDGHPPLTHSSDTQNFGVRLPFWKQPVTHEHVYVSPAQRI